MGIRRKEGNLIFRKLIEVLAMEVNVCGVGVDRLVNRTRNLP